MKSLIILILLSSLFISSCQESKTLPIIGQREFVDGDTIYHTIPAFEFVNQDSMIVTEKTFEDKIYVVDVFFTHCPTLCPRVMSQMMRIYDIYKDEDRFHMVSMTCDPMRDHVQRIKEYSTNLDVHAPKWHFLTGDKEELYNMADEYYIVAGEDPDAPGGFDHSGKIILIDENKHIRSFAEGQEKKSVDELIDNIQLLLDERK